MVVVVGRGGWDTARNIVKGLGVNDGFCVCRVCMSGSVIRAVCAISAIRTGGNGRGHARSVSSGRSRWEKGLPVAVGRGDAVVSPAQRMPPSHAPAAKTGSSPRFHPTASTPVTLFFNLFHFSFHTFITFRIRNKGSGE